VQAAQPGGVELKLPVQVGIIGRTVNCFTDGISGFP
jgi:hypothetical protein